MYVYTKSQYTVLSRRKTCIQVCSVGRQPQPTGHPGNSAQPNPGQRTTAEAGGAAWSQPYGSPPPATRPAAWHTYPDDHVHVIPSLPAPWKQNEMKSRSCPASGPQEPVDLQPPPANLPLSVVPTGLGLMRGAGPGPGPGDSVAVVRCGCCTNKDAGAERGRRTPRRGRLRVIALVHKYDSTTACLFQSFPFFQQNPSGILVQ